MAVSKNEVYEIIKANGPITVPEITRMLHPDIREYEYRVQKGIVYHACIMLEKYDAIKRAGKDERTKAVKWVIA